MTGEVGLTAVEAFWARRLGCSAADLHHRGVVVVARPEPVAFACLRSGALIVAAPAGWATAVAATLHGLTPDEAFAPERLGAAFGARAGEVIGPAYQGFADSGDVLPVPTEGVRRLGAGDRAALEALRLAAGETAWEHSAIDPDRPPVFGRFAAGVLVAAATLDGTGGPVASVGVLTHPGHRGRGHGRAVAGAATRAALDDGSVAHYQTLDANTPSVAIARALGFRRDATTLAVRLRDPAG
jgi:GNAT superfamily N-acetyltransferase